ncbi:hypothetical protein KC675_05445 [Candidatus Dojkabacteria bacterium]|uniref:Amidinotransferase n=1 Tax=Candidatus Dojkabacteria bacterium TaxID=2099670 RepID=A0A955IEP0_9BACT|nr:hypothetical protein [Candidatus Dojkabacteria bacterium]
MNSKKVIICKPTNFEVDFQVNPKLDKKLKIDKTKVFGEYMGLRNILKELGFEVIEINQEPNMPNMVYVGDWGFLYEDTFFVAKFKKTPRRKESKYAKNLIESMGYKTTTSPDRDYFSGADLFQTEDKYYFGWGKRAAVKSQDHLEKFLDTTLIDFKITDHIYNHLNKCLGPIDDNNVVYYPDAFNMIEHAKVCYHFPNPIAISDEDAKLYATSFIKINEKILVPKGISEELRTSLLGLGLDIIELKVDEYVKGGQGLKSLCLFL